MTRVEFFYIKKSMFTHYFLHYEKYIKKRMWIFYYIQTKGPKVSRTTDHFHTQHHQSCQQQDNGDWLI